MSVERYAWQKTLYIHVGFSSRALEELFGIDQGGKGEERKRKKGGRGLKVEFNKPKINTEENSNLKRWLTPKGGFKNNLNRECGVTPLHRPWNKGAQMQAWY